MSTNEAGVMPGAGPAENKGMRRVGSMSAGITLILIGAALAISLWADMKAYEVLSWITPFVFILLGAEVLLYVKIAGSGSRGVRYDWFSMFTVGSISLISLGLALLMSTGLFDELQRGLQMTQRSEFVNPQSVQVPEQIDKIVVQAFGGVEHDETDSRELQLFGQVRYWSNKDWDPSAASLLQTNTVGSTMYVMIGTVAHRDRGLFPDSVDPQLTLVLPKDMEIIWR